MLTINKILLPVVFTDNSAHFRQLACQAAWLARRFHAEIILLHVVTPFSYPYGLLESGHEITARDLEERSFNGRRKIWTKSYCRSLKELPLRECCSEATRPGK